MRYWTLSSIAAILAGYSALRFSQPNVTTPREFVPGQQDVVLFVSDSHPGLSNVQLAASSALAEKHPDIQVHFASFPKLEPRVNPVSDLAQTKNPQAKPIQWHELSGPDFATAFLRKFEGSTEGLIGPPAGKGISKLMELMELGITPMTKEEHFGLYVDVKRVIAQVDPSVVVIESTLYPAAEAALNMSRRTAFISPHGLSLHLASKQPWLAMFWKYPALGTGYPFPVPWAKIPSNLYVMFNFIKSILTSPSLKEARAFLTAKGVPDPVNIELIGRQECTWIAAGFPEGDLPLDHIPTHVVPCGPIAIDSGSVKSQDESLAAWLNHAPTMLVNLGSAFTYSKENADRLAMSLLPVLEKTENQVLWKCPALEGYDFPVSVKEFISSGRLRIEEWLAADTMSILRSDHVVLSVHHGGASSFNEAILAGVPQVILPLWVDLFSYAALSEHLGVGIWPNKDTAPEFTPKDISGGFLRALAGAESVALRQKAGNLAAIAASYGGQYTAAAKIAAMAAQGRK